ncbi:acylphosphatase [Oceanobacillus saliphilus]|uniref:acylphosphatase n=1 Tax=Oceanobacillus saliphilus TaxID=2925834 RepID=UPI00201D324D|nr:acylphosphatase [Oceanobacillus saliphilus]
MEEINTEWLPHLSNEIVANAHGNLLDAYVVALEGWRRGLTLKWHAKDHEKFKDMSTWFVDRPGQLFSLSSNEKTHYFFRTRGDKVTNEAVEIGKDKDKTKLALKQAGVPVPEGKQFSAEIKNETIMEYASDIGYPVVVKPTDGSFGRGVISNITSQNELDYSLTYVRSELNYPDIILEKYIPGDEYRLYVVESQVVGAIHRIPAHVVGDGVNSIKSLINSKNSDRSLNPRLISCPITLSKETLEFIEKKGYTADAVPPKSETVFLSDKSNISLGGDPVDVLDEIPEAIKNVAVRAIQAVKGLNHGAVDLIRHTSHSSEEIGVVLELNPTAQLGGILFPIKGDSRDVPAAIIDYYFPETKMDAMQKPPVYFDLQEVLEPIANNNAVSTQVKSLEKVSYYAQRYKVSGAVHKLSYHHWMKTKALSLSLIGYIAKLDDDNIEVVVAGPDKETLTQFKTHLMEPNQHAEVIGVEEEVWEEPLKIGFEIQGERKSILQELNNKDNDLLEIKKAQKVWEKKYQNMIGSYSWQITRPLRALGGVVKRIKGNIHT